jgi:hypothetical protein
MCIYEKALLIWDGFAGNTFALKLLFSLSLKMHSIMLFIDSCTGLLFTKPFTRFIMNMLLHLASLLNTLTHWKHRSLASVPLEVLSFITLLKSISFMPTRTGSFICLPCCSGSSVVFSKPLIVIQAMISLGLFVILFLSGLVQVCRHQVILSAMTYISFRSS